MLTRVTQDYSIYSLSSPSLDETSPLLEGGWVLVNPWWVSPGVMR